MLKQTLWANNVAPNLKELPIPLTGHCALMINNNLGLLLGGGTNSLDKTGAVDHTSEVNEISRKKIFEEGSLPLRTSALSLSKAKCFDKCN